MDFILVLGDLLGHRDFATGFVVDLRRRKPGQTMREVLRAGSLIRTPLLVKGADSSVGKGTCGRKEAKAAPASQGDKVQ